MLPRERGVRWAEVLGSPLIFLTPHSLPSSETTVISRWDIEHMGLVGRARLGGLAAGAAPTRGEVASGAGG